MILMEATRAERVAYLTYTFVTRGSVVAAEAATRAGVTPRTIQRDLAAIARVLPIYYDRGRWFFADDDTMEISPY